MHLINNRYLGAIQMICDTFWSILDHPPLRHVSFGDTGSDPPPVWRDNFHFTEKKLFKDIFGEI